MRLCTIAFVGVSICSVTRADHPSGVFGSGGAGPINFVSAGTLKQGSWSFATRVDYLGGDRFSDAELESFAAQGFEPDSIDFSLGVFLSLAYGLTDDITVTVRLPHAYQDDIREPEENGGVFETENEGHTSGLGDIMLLSVLKLFESECHSLQVSAIWGLEIPSGRSSDLTRELNVFELEHQPGSGSWDPLVGLAVSKSCGRWSFHANATYWWITEGSQDTNLGDVASYNAALVYQLLGHHNHDNGHDHGGHCGGHAGDHDHGDDDHAHDDHAHDQHDQHQHDQKQHGDDHHHGPTLDFVLELNGTWQEKHVIGSRVDLDSGGHLLTLSPGLRLTLCEHWSFFSSVGIPIIQDLNRANHELDVRIVLGASTSF